MGALWSGQKQADMSGSVTVPSEGWRHFRGKTVQVKAPQRIWEKGAELTKANL